MPKLRRGYDYRLRVKARQGGENVEFTRVVHCRDDDETPLYLAFRGLHPRDLILVSNDDGTQMLAAGPGAKFDLMDITEIGPTPADADLPF